MIFDKEGVYYVVDKERKPTIDKKELTMMKKSSDKHNSHTQFRLKEKQRRWKEEKAFEKRKFNAWEKDETIMGKW